MSRGDTGDVLGEFKVLQEKVGDLLFNAGTLYDLKASKDEVADVVVDAASVIGRQVVELLKWIARVEEAPSACVLPTARPLVFPCLPY